VKGIRQKSFDGDELMRLKFAYQASQILLDNVRDNHPFNAPSFLGPNNAEYTGGMERDYRTFKIITQKMCCELGKVRQVSHEHGILSKAGETNCPDGRIIIR
jgi:hypothetical protein